MTMVSPISFYGKQRAQKPNYVLITGGTSGIGYELAKLLHRKVTTLLLSQRDLAELENTAAGFSQQYEVEVVKICKDLFDTRNAFALYEEVLDKGIEVSILVNDAGQGQYGKFIDTDIQRELDIIQLNISSLVVLTKLFVKDMLQRGNGKILNLSSIAKQGPGAISVGLSWNKSIRAVVHGSNTC